MNAAFALDGDGKERAFKKRSLKRALHYIADHLAAHLGTDLNVRKLDCIKMARDAVTKALEANNTHRAIAIHDMRMREAVCVFDLSFAADRVLFAMATFGELMGPRASDFFIAQRCHFEELDSSLVWSRFSGKGNQKVERRRRGIPCRASCPRRDWAGASALQTCVEVDDVGMNPDTRCGACALRALWALHDGVEGGLGAGRQAFRALKPMYKKFSWEPRAQPMPITTEGDLDLARISSECFETTTISPTTLNVMFDKWARRMNALRHVRDPSSPKLREELWRPHGLRHGAVFNLKAVGVSADRGAPFLCMSTHMWETVYGLEDAEQMGDELLPGIVGSSGRMVAPVSTS